MSESSPAANPSTPFSNLVALGRREFVRLLQLGGIRSHSVTAEKAAAALAHYLEGGAAELVLFDAALLPALPTDLRERAFRSHRPQVVAVGGRWNEILRSRIRQVAGADLLLPQGEK
ncbi:MAG: hypothetical protein N3A66_00355 [Planctomycetota bacterium]|nr:hypothetical protein [Planctomycetota bacterium]